MTGILTKCKRRYVDLRGFHTKRHLVIFESDDWGSIRMPSIEVLQRLKEAGDSPGKDAFLRNDCLESEKDLIALFEVLTSVKDKNGAPAVLTANFAMANPDFDRIDALHGIYCYEPFYKTYKRYYPNQDVISVVHEGIKSSCFIPQLHCREHMNVNRWMADLKKQKSDTILAFQNKMIGVGESFDEENRFGYMDAFNSNFTTAEELAEILREAMEIFEASFGKKSETFVASCFVWDDKLEKNLDEIGVRGIQSGYWQNVPAGTNEKNILRRRLHFSGQKNHFGQMYTVRNCKYEPAYCQNPKESAQMCLEQVLFAFKHNKPAIINSHRFNYIGSIDPDNAKSNLKGLTWLLQKIVETIPEVEFISTAELIEIMNNEKE